MTHGLEDHLSKGAGETYLSTPVGDRSDRSHPRNDLHSELQTKTLIGAKPEKGYKISSDGGVSFFNSKSSL